MILIVGEDEDAILYLRSRLDLPRVEELFPSLKVYVGRMGGEEVAVASVGVGLPLVTLKTTALLEKYDPYVVYNIGSVGAIKSTLHQGDIFISERYYSYGIDYSGDGKNVYGQIPGLPPFFVGDLSLCEQAEKEGYELGGHYIERGSLLSGDVRIFDGDDVKGDLHRRFAGYSRLTCYDNCSYGIALACYLKNIAILTIKAVNYEANTPSQRLNFRRKGLEVMPSIGKIIAALLLRRSRI